MQSSTGRAVNINSFHANVSFLYPLKTSGNIWFSDVLGAIETEHLRSQTSIYYLLLIIDKFVIIHKAVCNF